MIDDRYGRLVVIGHVPRQRGDGHEKARVRCDCGREKVVELRALLNGLTRSCSCLQRESAAAKKLMHGYSRSKTVGKAPEYKIWQAIKNRCTNPRDKHWSYYGGRGITICDQWCESFAAFIADVGPRPSPELTLDRADNGLGYEPGNCRWATRREQSLNTRLTPAERSENCRRMAMKRWHPVDA